MKTLLAVISFMALTITFSGDAKADTCEYELVTRRGLVIDTIVEGNRYTTRYQACNEAERECRQQKRYSERRNRRGRAGMTCQKVRVRPNNRGHRGHRGHGRVNRDVVRTCTYKFDRRNPARNDSYFTATAVGPLGTGVQARACQEALDQCLVKDLFYKGTCVKN